MLVWWSGKCWRVIDGHHRFLAYKQAAGDSKHPLDIDAVPVEVFEGDLLGFIKTEMVSVPVIRAGKVQGYVVAQLSFAVNKTATKKLAFEPTPYLVDIAFRALYENSAIDFSQLQPQDLTLLAKKIAEGANAKLGGEVSRMS